MAKSRATTRERTSRRKCSVIVGPILSDLLGLGWDGEHAVIATAFYSERALHALVVAANELQVLCRLDVDDPTEWAKGLIAPDALLERLKSFEKKGSKIDLRVHGSAHAKVYAGANGVMIGSANLTLQGFGGGWEMVQASDDPADVHNVRAGLAKYARAMQPITLADLEAYTAKHSDFVRAYKKNHRHSHHRDKIAAPTARPPRLGDYEDFLKWVSRQSGEAAREIHARAHGKGNLRGHIYRNFFGLRQFLIAYPECSARFLRENPETYKLSKDAETERAIANYVRKHAVDETQFSLDKWKTYLPRECGGRAARHGGTIGNLNRMLPLVARYLASKARQ
jgi:hypothetical protein